MGCCGAIARRRPSVAPCGDDRTLTAGFAAEPQLAAAIASTRLMLRHKLLDNALSPRDEPVGEPIVKVSNARLLSFYVSFRAALGSETGFRVVFVERFILTSCWHRPAGAAPFGRRGDVTSCSWTAT